MHLRTLLRVFFNILPCFILFAGLQREIYVKVHWYKCYPRIKARANNLLEHGRRPIRLNTADQGLIDPHQNGQGRKGPYSFQRLIALKCLKCQKIQNNT
jgi:hypothetical protein